MWRRGLLAAARAAPSGSPLSSVAKMGSKLASPAALDSRRVLALQALAPLHREVSRREISHAAAPPFGRARAIELKYADGSCTLAVPLPLSGFDEERVFSFPPETTVEEVVRQIEAEDPSVQTVDVRSPRGKSFEPRDSLLRVLTDDFELVVNGRVMPVRAPVFAGGAYRSVLDDGDLDVRSVTQKSAIISLRHTVETLGKWKVSYPEFVQLCRDHGIPKKQAPEVLAAFHQAGIVFYFGKADDEDLQHAVFLHPRSVLDSYLESLGLTPQSTQLFQAERERLLAKIHALEPEHTALANLQRELDLAAHRQAGAIAYGLSTALVGTFGLYFWLSFIHFSWDIMEPVTYFTGFGVSILGYAWWSLTNQEYEYENIYHYVYSRRNRSLSAKANFDHARFQELEASMARARHQLAQTELVLAKATPLQASYLHLLEPKAHLAPPVPPHSAAGAA